MLTANEQLDKWQSLLDEHFAALHLERTNEKLPIFAIEHGRSQAEVQEIAEFLRKELAHGSTTGTHWLLWVVYAAELGYDYDGAEFWPSFESRTPYWGMDPDRRRSLRIWFHRFHKKFNGAVPTGAWANQFSIIAWPITHAVLPKDLQTQLARILYEQRYVIAEYADALPVQIGRIVALSADHASSRMRNFVEQEEVVGRIVLALLSTDSEKLPDTILPSALSRIVKDLEGRRNAKDWLHEARSVVQSVRLAHARNAEASHSQSTNGIARTVSPTVPSIRPRLMMQRVAADVWKAFVEIPSFEGLAKSSADYAAFLRTSRCRIPAAGPTWYPPTWLLYGSQTKSLSTWPDSNTAIVEMEKVNSDFSRMLTDRCRIDSCGPWFFRVRQDGRATEISTSSVRSECEYLLVQHSPFSPHPFIRPIELQCGGVVAARLLIPTGATPNELQSLATIGISVDRTIRVWPVGLPPRRWNPDGIEILEGETLCLALSQDNGSDHVSISLDGREHSDVKSCNSSHRTLVSVGPLACGQHSLMFSPVYGESRVLHRSKGQVSFRVNVRPRNRWIPGVTSHSGMVVVSDPHDPTLDLFFKGNVEISIFGPENSAASCFLELLDASGNSLWSSQRISVTLPASTRVLKETAKEILSEKIPVASLMRASHGRFSVDGGELGQFALQLRHFVSPLRWIAEEKPNLSLSLIDDSAHNESLTLWFASFEYPLKRISLPNTALLSSITPPENGGMYVAKIGENIATIVASNLKKKSGLNDLAMHPDLQINSNSSNELVELLISIQLWNDTSFVGALAAQRRSIIVKDLIAKLMESLCGARWAKAEDGFRLADPTSEYRAAILDSEFGHTHIGFAVALQRASSRIVSSSIQTAVQTLVPIASGFKQCYDESLCEAALRIALAPESFVRWARDEAADRVTLLRQVSPLLRGLRYVAVLSDPTELRRAREGWRI